MNFIARTAGETFTLPTLDYRAMAPIVILLAAGVISVLVEAFAPRRARRPLQLVLVFASLLVATGWLVSIAGVRTITGSGSVVIDGPALVLQGTLLVVALLAACLIAERSIDPSGDSFAPRASALPGSQDEREFTNRGYFQTEVWPLFLFSVGGMLLFVAAGDLLTMFVALEVMSLPLYLMAGMARRRRLLSQEAALKYFILGAFASAFFLFGAALTYGYAGSVNFGAISLALGARPTETGLALAGVALLAIGLLFKVSAVPFHQWTPDVYQGSPTPVTAFMAATVKVAAFGALLRLLYVAFAGLQWDWTPALWVIAILTMVYGSLVAVAQSDIKRMLAYSSIAQAGFLLVGLVAVTPAGLLGVLFYLVAYGFTTIGAFAIVSMVRNATGEANNLASWAGLGRKSPLVGGLFALFMLSLAGIPLTAGFIGKFSVFTAAVDAGAQWLVVVAVLMSVVAAFFYIRVIVVMFFTAPNDQTASVVVPSAFTAIALAASAAVTVILGVAPQPVLDLLRNAEVFLR